MEKKFEVNINKKWCKHCMLCVEFCPVKNLEFTGDKIKDKGKCTGCRLCEKYCPDYAIEVKEKK
ncbi:4Fe-4S dicluster domain-containing protein [Candidatus Woesearchaeota archaeon]|nr:4Fe-4S dicluster domain-containing protein [Candidatus Woesearchaeota archaeon]